MISPPPRPAATPAPPASPPDGAPQAPPPLPATAFAQAPGLARRMACWLYEGVLLFGVVFIADYLFSALTQTRNALDNRHAQQGFLFVVFGIYFTWFWSRGQTLAMKTWHIRIVDRHGNPVGQARALCRYLLAWVWLLPPLAVMAPLHPSMGETAAAMLGWVAVWALASRLHPSRQFWHDALAGTRLVTAAARA
ncbi:RDD family protein [Ramlibacter sp. H39-3-26]|uniref:RDD family protein n=1 Tax=Curvibacter soli TaxID=3031331 RepID=UPI0023DB9162|nr:RDD family protein [Ramlibacter sp. H39-3-26]MDF1485225.1 RDD family protein [Ramlibacter sp. H39-3-26]